MSDRFIQNYFIPCFFFSFSNLFSFLEINLVGRPFLLIDSHDLCSTDYRIFRFSTSLSTTGGTTETPEDARVNWRGPSTKGRVTGVSIGEATATAKNMDRTTIWSLRIFIWTVLVIVLFIPVRTPFPDIAVHIVYSPFVWFLLSYRMCLVP